MFKKVCPTYKKDLGRNIKIIHHYVFLVGKYFSNQMHHLYVLRSYFLVDKHCYTHYVALLCIKTDIHTSNTKIIY